jgi:hypothetical protein
MPIVINGRSLAALGVSARELSGWRDGPETRRAFRGLPGSTGGLLAPQAVGAARELRLVLNVPDAATLDVLDDVTHGLVRLVFEDLPTRVIRVVRTQRSVTSIAPSLTLLNPKLLVSYVFTAADGASYDVEPRLLAIGTTPVPIALGTLPSAGVLQVPGGWSGTRTLTYRGANGVPYAAFALTVPSAETFASSEYLEIDLARRTIVRVDGSAVRSNAYGWRASGAWFAPDPTDGHVSGAGLPGASPTLAMSAGTALFRYRRAWSV